MKYDELFIYLLIIVIPLLAQISINMNYSKYKKRDNSAGLTGKDVARKILDANGLEDIKIIEVSGSLTDNYNPSNKCVNLSSEIYNDTTIAAASVAAHECGHAIQDKEGYTFMRIRSFLVPIVNISSYFSWVVIFIGLAASIFKVFIIGIILVSVGLVFQLITLPVEFNASSRAKDQLVKLHLVGEDEDSGVKKMLFSAALTYVAGVLTAILQILRLILMFSNKDN